jgi:hypothetical protein
LYLIVVEPSLLGVITSGIFDCVGAKFVEPPTPVEEDGAEISGGVVVPWPVEEDGADISGGVVDSPVLLKSTGILLGTIIGGFPV